MKPRHVVINLRWTARVLAWSALVIIAGLFALFLQSLAAIALVATRSAEPPAACQSISSAALVDGHYVDTRFLADVCGDPINRVSAATASLADGDDVRSRFLASLPNGAIEATSAP